jgi:hypothetical protein
MSLNVIPIATPKDTAKFVIMFNFDGINTYSITIPQTKNITKYLTTKNILSIIGFFTLNTPLQSLFNSTIKSAIQ